MRDRVGWVVKILCLVLMMVVAYKLVGIASRVNPLARVVIPDLPTLASDKTTNVPAGMAGTNSTKSIRNTNSPTTGKTNLLVEKSTNNAVSNSAAPMPAAKMKGLAAEPTNVALSTNLITPALAIGTNNPVSNSVSGGTNITAPNGMILAKGKRKGATGPSAQMLAMMGGRMGGAPLPELAPEIKARIDRIYESEILAQVMRPLPMGLLGIAGDIAFLRTASGQTGLIKPDEILGDLKLLKIGINRVLVEQAGQKKELIIFGGYGSKSLMPEERETSK